MCVATGFLCGVEVYGETVLDVVGDKAQKLKWPGYGFYMEIPDGALPPGVTAIVGVKMILSGQFKLPRNTRVISAMYCISFSKNFLKKVAINIRHFAVTMSEKRCSEFRFIVAEFSQKELPYNFQKCEGLFAKDSQFAAIKLNLRCPFTLVGEIGPENTEMRFLCLKFYKPIPGTLKVDMVFVVTYNDELFLEVHAHLLDANSYINFSFCNQIIRKEYCSYLEDGQGQMLDFDSDTMVLDLPASGSPAKLVNGWKILPLTCRQVLILCRIV